jgi:hypothetical protein
VGATKHFTVRPKPNQLSAQKTRKPTSAHVFYPLLCAVFLGPTSRKPPVRSLLFVNLYSTKLPKKINLQLSLKFPQKIQSQSAESREEAKNLLSVRKTKKPSSTSHLLVRSTSPVRPCRQLFSFPIKPKTRNQPEKRNRAFTWHTN